MNQLSPRRRRPTHRLRLDQRARPWQPLRADGLERSFARAIELDASEATLDEGGHLRFSLGGLLKTMVASRPDTLSDRTRRARCVRLREIADGLAESRAICEAMIAMQIASGDVAEVLIAGLGGIRLREAFAAGEGAFFTVLDRALAQRLG